VKLKNEDSKRDKGWQEEEVRKIAKESDVKGAKDAVTSHADSLHACNHRFTVTRVSALALANLKPLRVIIALSASITLPNPITTKYRSSLISILS